MMTENKSENGDSLGGISRTNSSQSMDGTTQSMPVPESMITRNDQSWDTFTTNSSLSISPSSIPQPYNQPLSTDDYADLLDCITDQAYFDNMDLSDFSDCMATVRSQEFN